MSWGLKKIMRRDAFIKFSVFNRPLGEKVIQAIGKHFFFEPEHRGYLLRADIKQRRYADLL